MSTRTSVTGILRVLFQKLLPRTLWESERLSQATPAVQVSQFNWDPFPFQLHFPSTVLPHGRGSMKLCAPRLTNSQGLRAARTLGPASSLQLRVPPASQINQPQPLHCHSLLRIPPKLPTTNSSSCPLYNGGLLIHPYILGKANYSSFLTLTWNFVANTEPSTWSALPVSKCPQMTYSYRSRSDATPSLSFSSSQPEMRSPSESTGACI